MSVRYELMAGEFITAGLNFSSDAKAKTDSMGLFAKWNHMLSSNWARSFPYVFVQTGYLAQKASDKSKRESSMVSALGLGVEVSVIREISTSVETGFGGTLWPSSSATIATATTQLMIHYHFQF